MKFFWQKPTQPEPQLAAQAEPQGLPTDVVAVARAVAKEAAQEAAETAALEVTRAFASSTLAAQQDVQRQAAQSSPPVYAMDNPITFATPTSPRHRPMAPVSVDTLRKVADTYDVLRSCVQHLKREVAAVPVEIVAKDDKDNSPKTRRQIRDAQAFLDVFGGLGGVGQRRQHFERQIMEDVLVIGAAAMFYDETLGGNLSQIIAIDAATIRPIVDGYGFLGTGENAYEQWVQGVAVAQFTREQLRYDGLHPVSYSPFFKTPIEWILGPINAALRADAWNLAWLTDGNSANQTYAMPEDWSPDKIKTWMLMWEAQCAGNNKNRQKTRFVPGGTQKVGDTSRKDADFQEFEWWLARRCFAVMGVQPASVGYVGEQYKVSQEGSMASTSLFGAGELLDFRKETYDDIWARMGFDRIQTRNVIAREEDAKARAERHEIEIRSGKRSINECRQESGEDPCEGGDVHLVQSTLMPLDFVGTTFPNENAETANDDVKDDETKQNPSDDKSARLRATTRRETAPDTKAQSHADRALWMRKSLKRLKDKGAPACSFESAFISREISRAIERGLASCGNDVDAVREVFRSTLSLEDVADEIAALDELVSQADTARLFALLSAAQSLRLKSHFTDLASGSLEIQAAESALFNSLAEAHTNAAHLGRIRASDVSAQSELDRNIGQRVADEQIQYAEKFAQQVADGKYTNEDGTVNEAAIEARAELYEKRLRGTANESWLSTLDELVYWEFGDTVDHCTECESLADGSPYKPSALPTIPGNGATPCVHNCGCGLRTESGATGF